MTSTKKNVRLLISYIDLGLGGIQKKIVDIVQYLQLHHPEVKIQISLRFKTGIFLGKIPPGVTISTPPRPFYRFGTFRFFLWMVKEIFVFRPTHILTFMDSSSVPTLSALNVVFWRKAVTTIGEDILTSKYLTDLYGPLAGNIRLKLIKIFYPRSSKVIVQTPIQKNDLDKLLNQKTSNVSALSNWLPLDYPPKPTMAKRDIDILYVGRIAAQKNLTRFVKIINQFHQSQPKLTVYIVGSGEESKKIKKLIYHYQLQKVITMIPQTDNPQSFYLRAKTFLLASNYEGFPLTLMEAIASGCRPVCYDLPEIRDLFKSEPQYYLFKKQSQAVSLLKSPIPRSFVKYQNTIIKLQNKNIKKYIDAILN